MRLLDIVSHLRNGQDVAETTRARAYKNHGQHRRGTGECFSQEERDMKQQTLSTY